MLPCARQGTPEPTNNINPIRNTKEQFQTSFKHTTKRIQKLFSALIRDETSPLKTQPKKNRPDLHRDLSAEPLTTRKVSPRSSKPMEKYNSIHNHQKTKAKLFLHKLRPEKISVTSTLTSAGHTREQNHSVPKFTSHGDMCTEITIKTNPSRTETSDKKQPKATHQHKS